MRGNVFFGNPAQNPICPAQNFYPTSFAGIGFASPTGTYQSGNYSLSGGPYKGQATDGNDPGVNWQTLKAATLHTVDGQWGGSVPPPVPPSPGCQGGLPVPTLNIPAFLPINATISASIPSGCSVDHFIWTFTPAPGTQVSNAQAKSFSASSNVATLATPIRSINFSQASLTLGTYFITVQSADGAGNSSQASAPVPGHTRLGGSFPR